MSVAGRMRKRYSHRAHRDHRDRLSLGVIAVVPVRRTLPKTTPEPATRVRRTLSAAATGRGFAREKYVSSGRKGGGREAGAVDWKDQTTAPRRACFRRELWNRARADGSTPSRPASRCKRWNR